jgi:hypothetical protein
MSHHDSSDHKATTRGFGRQEGGFRQR